MQRGSQEAKRQDWAMRSSGNELEGKPPGCYRKKEIDMVWPRREWKRMSRKYRKSIIEWKRPRRRLMVEDGVERLDQSARGGEKEEKLLWREEKYVCFVCLFPANMETTEDKEGEY